LGNTALVINEKQVIRCMVDDPQKSLRLEKNMFISPVGRALYDAVLELFTKNIAITRDHLLAEGNRRCNQVTEGIVDTVYDDADYVPDAFEKMYLPRLRSDYGKKLIEDSLLKSTLLQSSSKDALDAEQVRSLMDQMREALDLYEGKASKLLSLEQAGRMYEQQLRQRASGASYRVSEANLNRALQGGFLPRQMTVLFGATGLGKSAYAMNLVNRDINKQNPAMYASLEMDLISSFDRIAGIRLHIPFSSLMPNPDTGLIDSFVLEAISAELNRLRRNDNFFFIEEDSLTIIDLEQLIKEAQRRAAMSATSKAGFPGSISRDGYMVIYIDLMTMLKDFSGGEAGEYEDGMNRIHEMCRRRKVHIVNVVQANRKADDTRISSIEQLEQLRPRRNTIKNSQAILERCRNQLSVFRPRYYAEQLFPTEPALADMPDTLEVQVLKQSMGPVGKIVKYLYDGPTFSCIPIRDDMPSAS
jgi:replicative DNA helicase